MDRQRLRREVELQVCREEFDTQARRLQATNCVYNDAKVKYRTDLNVRPFRQGPAQGTKGA